MTGATDRARPGTAARRVAILVEGEVLQARAGLSLAAALIEAGIVVLRRSPAAATPRGAFCLMGVCQECTVLVDGRPERACMTTVREGLSVALRGPHGA